jgi:hypothetical protein
MPPCIASGVERVLFVAGGIENDHFSVLQEIDEAPTTRLRPRES